MKSQYITFILRMRLDPHGVHPSTVSSVHGSIQQIGQEQIRHFNSFDQFLEIIRETVDEAPSAPVLSPDD